jgi:UDP-glucuronate decarboxylase
MLNIIGDDINQIIENLNNISFEDQTILVTGGSGFIGSWICQTLINLSGKVLCVDNMASGLRSNIDHLMELDNFQFIPHDISIPIYFDKKIDLIIHLASRASPTEFMEYPIQILKANTMGTLRALGIAKKHNARILYASTSEVYGMAEIIPTPEEYHGKVNLLGPRSCYDESKRCGEAYVSAYNLQYGLDTRIARIFNTYGPRMRSDGLYGRSIPRFINQAITNMPITIYGDGLQTRSFCYISDQIEGLLRLAALDNAKGFVINIGSTCEVPIIDLAKKILNISMSKSEISYYPLPCDDPLRRQPDITRAKLLGWVPKVELEEGLERTIDWFRCTNLHR